MNAFINILTLLLMLSIFSFLFKENAFFRFTERFLVGITAGYGFLIIYYDGFLKKFYQPLFSDGNFSVIIPGLIGLLFFGQLFKRTGFLTKYPIAFLLGTGAGLEIGPRIETAIIRQLNASILDLGSMTLFESFNYIVIIIGLICTMYYFLFVLRGKSSENMVSKIGIYFMMVSFGATFGYTIMARISLLIDRVNHILSFVGM